MKYLIAVAIVAVSLFVATSANAQCFTSSFGQHQQQAFSFQVDTPHFIQFSVPQQVRINLSAFQGHQFNRSRNFQFNRGRNIQVIRNINRGLNIQRSRTINRSFNGFCR